MFGLVEDVTHEIETRRRIEHERDHDILTGLLNRRAFECEVTQRLEDDPPPIAAMMMLDLDNLKYINDTYGHDWGDHYIKAAGRAVSLTFQGSGLFARISGDEFLMFVDRCPDRASIDALFDAFRHSLETSELEAPDGRTLKVRASMGVAYYPQDAGDFARLREYADFAMYMAKSSRKGELFTFEDESYREKSFILNNKEELNRLLEESLISYHFQPIVDARAGEVAAYEALMRPQIESIPTPDRVLALARSQSKLYRVEHVTFFGALETYARFPQSGRHHAVRQQHRDATALRRRRAGLQERYGDLLKRVVIEITESEYSREMALYKEALAHRFGARLAIDDFGSGYNGETSLLDYRADFVKIDMGIVRDIDTVKDHQDIAKSLISYAHDRGISVVAEGIETEAELAKHHQAWHRLPAGLPAGQATGRTPGRARRHQAAHSLDRRRRAVVTLVETLHIEAASVRDERAEAVMPVTPDVLQPFGFVHGGATIALLETVASLGAQQGTDLETRASLSAWTCGCATARAVSVGHAAAAWPSSTASEVSARTGGVRQFWSVAAYDDEGDVVSDGVVMTKIVPLARLAEKERERAAARGQEQPVSGGA